MLNTRSADATDLYVEDWGSGRPVIRSHLAAFEMPTLVVHGTTDKTHQTDDLLAFLCG